MRERLRVGLDLTPAVVGTTGVVRYALELDRELRARDDVEVRAFSAGRRRRTAPGRHLPIPLRVVHRLWAWTGQPRAELLTGRIDVVHSTDLVPPPSRAPLVVSLQDVLPLVRPDLYSERATREHAAKLAAVRSRRPVIVVSTEAVADEVVEHVGVPRDRIVVAPLGPSGAPIEPRPAGVEGEGILAVGVVTPRKGYDVLADAVARVGADCPPVDIVGPDGYLADEVRRRVGELDRYGRIRFVGEVDDEELAACYRKAGVVVHPSVAEGFGIVCVEAMRAGVPLVAAGVPAVREVVGDAGILVEPGDAEQLAAAIADVLGDRAKRDELATAGPVRAARYSWAAMADATVGAYRLATSS